MEPLSDKQCSQSLVEEYMSNDAERAAQAIRKYLIRIKFQAILFFILSGTTPLTKQTSATQV